MADRYDDLNPTNLVATLRSLPRRFDAVAGPMRSDPELFEAMDRPGPSGESMLDILDRTMRAVSILAAEATRVCTHNEPVSNSDAFDPDSWAPADAMRASTTEAVDVLSSTAEELADLLDRQDGDGWSRTTSLTGGGTMSLVTIVRSIAREAIEGLRRAERQLEWLRSP